MIARATRHGAEKAGRPSAHGLEGAGSGDRQRRAPRGKARPALPPALPAPAAPCLPACAPTLRLAAWAHRRRGAVRELEQWQAENPGAEGEPDLGSLHFADRLQVGGWVGWVGVGWVGGGTTAAAQASWCMGVDRRALMPRSATLPHSAHTPCAHPGPACHPTTHPTTQIGNMVLHAWLHALEVLEAAAGGARELPPFPPPLEEPWQDPEEAKQQRQKQQRPRGKRAEVGGEAGGEGGEAGAGPASQRRRKQ